MFRFMWNLGKEMVDIGGIIGKGAIRAFTTYEFEEDRQAREKVSKPKILLIYDTSWLMAPEEYEFHFAKDYNFELIILDSVKKEVMNHIHGDNEEKKIAATKARTTISEIMIDKNYTEYREEDIPELNVEEQILGPDSKEDRLILSFASQHADILSGDLKIETTFAFILTHDGGIKLEAVTLFKKYRKLIFTKSSINELHELLEKIESLIEKKIMDSYGPK
jgi:hypothetical protein